MKKIRIIIADDHAVLRKGLSLLLNGQPDMEVVGEASDGTAAIEAVRQYNPDIALLDITMPKLSGVQVVAAISKEHPATRSIALTMHEDAAYVRSVLAAGGSGYVAKRAADVELLQAIRAVAAGGIYVGAGLHDVAAEQIQERLTDSTTAGKQSVSRDVNQILTPREQEVLLLLAEGHTNAEIADKLHVSVKTAETHRARIYKKMGFERRSDLVRFAIEMGLLET